MDMKTLIVRSVAVVMHHFGLLTPEYDVYYVSVLTGTLPTSREQAE